MTENGSNFGFKIFFSWRSTNVSTSFIYFRKESVYAIGDVIIAFGGWYFVTGDPSRKFFRSTFYVVFSDTSSFLQETNRKLVNDETKNANKLTISQTI